MNLDFNAKTPITPSPATYMQKLKKALNHIEEKFLIEFDVKEMAKRIENDFMNVNVGEACERDVGRFRKNVAMHLVIGDVDKCTSQLSATCPFLWQCRYYNLWLGQVPHSIMTKQEIQLAETKCEELMQEMS